jgi:histidinol phosphatase-like enzyme (inositol monophosphatase family)
MFTREIKVALQVTKAAGEIALAHQAKGLNPEIKPDDSPVTAADRESERLIAKTLGNAFPEDGVLGEEGSRKESRNGRRWIVDPIDGTRDFIRGLPLWCTMIALEENGEVKAGVVHFPPLNRTYWASRGGGAFRDGSRLQASRISHAANAVLSLNGLNKMNTQPMGAGLLAWAEQFWSIRSLGGTLDAMLVAAGAADVWIEASNVQPWDLAAPQVILEEAGAVFMDFFGERSIYSGHAAACAPALESQLRAFLKTMAER